MKSWLVIGLVSLVVLETAHAQNPASIESAKASHQKYWEGERTRATEVLATNPNAIDAYRLRGWALYGLEQYKEALVDFKQATKLDPHDEDAVLGEGRCHRLLGENDAAVADFTRAHELSPTSARPLCERGAILILQEKYDVSLADYIAAEKLDPNYPGLYSYIAELHIYRREPEKALAAVKEEEKHEPDMLICKVNEAHAYLFMGDMAKAKSIYLANKGRSDPTEGRTYPQIILNDFRLMRAAGVTTPGMDEIEALMRAP